MKNENGMKQKTVKLLINIAIFSNQKHLYTEI